MLFVILSIQVPIFVAGLDSKFNLLAINVTCTR